MRWTGFSDQWMGLSYEGVCDGWVVWYVTYLDLYLMRVPCVCLFRFVSDEGVYV